MVGFLYKDGKIYLVKMPKAAMISVAKDKPGQHVMINDLVEIYPNLINVDIYLDESICANMKSGHIGMIIKVSSCASLAFNLPVGGDIKRISTTMPPIFFRRNLTSRYVQRL